MQIQALAENGEKSMYYIGVDLGTSAVKLLLMQADGKISKIVSKEYPLFFPHPGWSEQNPSDWWSAVKEGIKEHKCECCNNIIWMGNPIPLELHHVNGIKSDLRIENLQMLCSNCHIQTDNFGAKNIK